ncbi:chitin synthase-domain-containing protein [Jimgerdemannia flammicorona]|uniref:chitin synthase n=1 Tax=Jimgerdemannia flammicorona TaxID=994334 RepID=A0A433QQ31_9FUNG|nr:chitin synthase-domain-containing protein [Jimgerdemannia flammicorona]
MSSTRRKQAGGGAPEMARNPASSASLLIPDLRQTALPASILDQSWDYRAFDINGGISSASATRPGNPSSPVLAPTDSLTRHRQAASNGSGNLTRSTQSSTSSSAHTDGARTHLPATPQVPVPNVQDGESRAFAGFEGSSDDFNRDSIVVPSNQTSVTSPPPVMAHASVASRRRVRSFRDSMSSTGSGGGYNKFDSRTGMLSLEQQAAGTMAMLEARVATRADPSGQGASSRNSERMQQRTTWERRIWVMVSRICTCFVPDLVLRTGRLKDKDARQAWREKVTICILIAAASALVIVWLEVFAKLFCSASSFYYYTDIVSSTSKMVVVNGKAIDLSGQPPGGVASVVNRYPGKDLSPLFPTFTLLARRKDNNTYGEPMIERCLAEQELIADRWLYYRLVNDTGLRIEQHRLRLCPDPNNPKQPGPPCFYNTSSLNQLKKGVRGDIIFTRDYVASCSTINNCSYVILNGRVYDVTDYLNSVSSLVPHSSQHTTGVARKLYLNRMFLPLNLTEVLLLNLGQDITSYYYGNVTQNADLYIKCMDRLFYRGIVDDTVLNGCANYNPVLWASLSVGLLVSLLKINFTSLVRMPYFRRFLSFTSKRNSLAPTSNSSDRPPHCILMVPCYAEPPEILRETIESLARSSYDDKRRLLMFVCDGVVTGLQSTRETHQLVLEILGYGGPDPTRQAYISQGQNAKKTNFAKVYSGYYETGSTHRVPYIVIVKIGNSMEIVKIGNSMENRCPKPGNRGKRDSMLMAFAFLERCMDLKANLITPFEYELYHQMYDVLGIDPRLFKYFMVIDADTRVRTEAVQRMVDKMESNEELLAVSGDVRPANPDVNIVTMLQIFQFYLTYNATVASEACLGSVISMSGGFVMYRIWFGEGIEEERKRRRKGKAKARGGGVARNIHSAQDESSMLSTISLSPTSAIQPCCVHPTVLRDLTAPQPDTLHMKNVLLMGEDHYLSTVLLRSHPRHRLGFEPDAISYASLPTTFAALQGQQRRAISSALHNLVELCKVPSHSGVGLRLLALGKLACMLLIPIVVLNMYSLLMLLFIRGWFSYLIAVVSISGVLVLHMLYFLLQWRLKYILWLLLHCSIAIPLFCVWFPLVAFWSADEGDYWYDVWPTTNEQGEPKRLHGILDDTADDVVVPIAGIVYGDRGDEGETREDGLDDVLDGELAEANTSVSDILDDTVPRKRLQEYVAAEEHNHNAAGDPEGEIGLSLPHARGTAIEDPATEIAASTIMNFKSENSVTVSPMPQIHDASGVHTVVGVPPLSSYKSKSSGSGSELDSVWSKAAKHANEDLLPTAQDPFASPFDHHSENSYGSPAALIEDHNLVAPETTVFSDSPFATIRSKTASQPSSTRSRVIHHVQPSHPTVSAMMTNESTMTTGAPSSSRPIISRWYLDGRDVTGDRLSLQSNGSARLSRSSIAGSDLSLPMEEAVSTTRSDRSNSRQLAIHRCQPSDPSNRIAINNDNDNNGLRAANHTKLGQLIPPDIDQPLEICVHRPTRFSQSSTTVINSTPRHFALHPTLPGGSTSAPTANVPPAIPRSREQRDLRADIRNEINFFLQDADLGSITRRQVKDHLFVEFGDEVQEKGLQLFINECIQKFTVARLGLLAEN